MKRHVAPLTHSLGLLHGVSCCQDMFRVKGHHGLHLQDGGVGERVVHTVFDPENDRRGRDDKKETER